jgi:hypothetical protein
MADVVVSPGGGRRILKPLLVSRILGRTFKTWITSLPQLLVIAALVLVPFFVLHWFLLGAAGWRKTVSDMLPMVQTLAVTSIGQAFAVRFVFQRLRGDAADLGRSIAVGRARVGTVAAIDLLLSTPLLAYLGALLYLTHALIRSSDPTLSAREMGNFASKGTGAMAIGIASLLYYVFQLVVILVFPVAAPAAVVENRGVFASLRRSAGLTQGRRTTIFGIYFVYAMACLLPVGSLSLLIFFEMEGTGQFAARCAFDLLFASLTCVLPIVLYHELRETLEGIGIDELASVFD